MEMELNGTRLFYTEDGMDNSGSVPVLFLHGWGCTHSVFSWLVSSLSMPSVTVDFPGHGQSGEPSEPWDVANYAQQILLLLDSLSIQRVHVVAHSFGGRIAIWIASHYPERIGKMVLTGAAGIRKTPNGKKQFRNRMYRTAQNALNGLKKSGLFRKPVESLQKKLFERFASPDYVKLSPLMRETFKKVINEDLSPLLPEIHASTLLVWGTEDTETPLWMGEKMEKDIPDAALIRFEGKGHFAFAQEASRFSLIVKAFFAGDETV